MTQKKVNQLMNVLKTRQELQQDTETAPEPERATEPILTQKKGIVEKARKGKKGKESRPGKSADDAYRQVNIYLLKQAHDEATMQLIKEGRKRDFSELIGDLLDAWLRKQKA